MNSVVRTSADRNSAFNCRSKCEPKPLTLGSVECIEALDRLRARLGVLHPIYVGRDGSKEHVLLESMVSVSEVAHYADLLVGMWGECSRMSSSDQLEDELRTVMLGALDVEKTP